MLVFYRGLHCPICKGYLRDLDRRLEDFAKRGVEAVAVSTDTQERAERSRSEWGIEHLTIAYALSIEQARQWGLCGIRSKAAGNSDPFQPLIPTQTSHRFRSKPATLLTSA